MGPVDAPLMYPCHWNFTLAQLSAIKCIVCVEVMFIIMPSKKCDCPFVSMKHHLTQALEVKDLGIDDDACLSIPDFKDILRF